MKATRLHVGIRMVESGVQRFEGVEYDVFAMLLMVKEHGVRDFDKIAAVTTKRMFPKGSPKALVAEILIKEAMSNPAVWGKLLTLQDVVAVCEKNILAPNELGDALEAFAGG